MRSSDDSEQERPFVDIRDIQKALRQELGHAWRVEDSHDPKSMLNSALEEKIDARYPSLDQDAQQWLGTYAGYDHIGKCWSGIPADAEFEKKLYTPIQVLLHDIAKGFGNLEQLDEDGTVIKTRLIKVTSKVQFDHSVADPARAEDALKSCPDIGIFGTGSAATPETALPNPLKYAHLATPLEIKLHETFAETVKDQVAVYGREVFLQQPNRRFVYVPVMTKKTLRVVHFDRSGAHASVPFDYHKNPLFFVKLVVLFTSLHEDLLGYDTTIFWRDGRRLITMIPREVWDGSQWIANNVENGLEFEVLDTNLQPGANAAPFFARRTIRSRGTLCWRVRHNKSVYLIKDYWRADGRTAESAFLKELAGIDGIAEMFSYEDRRESTYGLRGIDTNEQIISTSNDSIPNRWLTRVVLALYGDDLGSADSPLELLYAVRDIVSGHRKAFLTKRILHRDASLNNLLLRLRHGQRPGGVLVDFDMAKKIDDVLDGRVTEGDARTGTRTFQSIRVLGSDLGVHDHMDDLESIFYVLCFVVYGHDQSGRKLAILPQGISVWINPNADPLQLAFIKKGFLMTRINCSISRFAGKSQCNIVHSFILRLQDFFRAHFTSVVDVDAHELPPYIESVAAEHYSQFLAIVDNTIEKLEALPPLSATSSPPIPAIPSPPLSSGSASPKRKVNDDPFSDLPVASAPGRKRPTSSSVSTAGPSSAVGQNISGGESSDEASDPNDGDYEEALGRKKVRRARGRGRGKVKNTSRR